MYDNLYNDFEFVYEYSDKYISNDKNNNLYIRYNNVLIPIYEINGINNESCYIINNKKMGKLCRNKINNYFNIEVFDYVSDLEHLEKTMKETIAGCSLENNEKRNYLLESVNIVIREYVKYDNKDIDGYKILYNN